MYLDKRCLLCYGRRKVPPCAAGDALVSLPVDPWLGTARALPSEPQDHGRENYSGGLAWRLRLENTGCHPATWEDWSLSSVAGLQFFLGLLSALWRALPLGTAVAESRSSSV